MPLTPEQCQVGHYIRICDGIAANEAVGRITRVEPQRSIFDDGRIFYFCRTQIVWMPSDYDSDYTGIGVGMHWSVYDSEAEYIGETYTPPHEPRYRPTREYLIADRIGYSPQTVLDNPPPPSVSPRSPSEIEADSQDFADETDFYDDIESDPDEYVDDLI